MVERSPLMQKIRPKLLRQVVTAPLPNGCLEVCVSQVLGDHHNKELNRVRVGAACKRSIPRCLRTFDPAFCAYFWSDLLFPKFCIIFHLFW